MDAIVVSRRVIVPGSAIAMHTARSGGPGGQNVNKVSSKVELRVELEEILGLTADQLARLRARAASRLDEAGRLVVTSQRTRSQAQNLDDAREKILELVRAALVAPKRRLPTKPSRAAKARRMDEKRKQSNKKRERRVQND